MDVVQRMLGARSGAEGNSRKDRGHAAHRIHVDAQPHQAPRQPRADGRNLQRLRSPDRGALHHLARRAKPRRRRAHQGADVHLRGSGQARVARPSRPCCRRWTRRISRSRSRAPTIRSRNLLLPTCRPAPASCSRTTWKPWAPVRLKDVDEAQGRMVVDGQGSRGARRDHHQEVQGRRGDGRLMQPAPARFTFDLDLGRRQERGSLVSRSRFDERCADARPGRGLCSRAVAEGERRRPHGRLAAAAEAAGRCRDRWRRHAALDDAGHASTWPKPSIWRVGIGRKLAAASVGARAHRRDSRR